MHTIERQSLPVFLDENGNPIAIIFFNKARERIIYTLTKSDEDGIIELFTCNNKTIKAKSYEDGNFAKAEWIPEDLSKLTA